MIINDAIRNPHTACKPAIRDFLRANPGSWSTGELVSRLNCLREQPFRFDRADATRALNALLREGEVVKSGDGKDATYCCAAVAEDVANGTPRLAAKDEQPFEQRIWNAIRVLKYFSLADVELTARTERNFTQRYLQRLLDAKLIARTGARRDTYRFNANRNIGPNAPYLALSLMMVDPNSEKVINIIDSQKVEPWT